MDRERWHTPDRNGLFAHPEAVKLKLSSLPRHRLAAASAVWMAVSGPGALRPRAGRLRSCFPPAPPGELPRRRPVRRSRRPLRDGDRRYGTCHCNRPRSIEPSRRPPERAKSFVSSSGPLKNPTLPGRRIASAGEPDGNSSGAGMCRPGKNGLLGGSRARLRRASCAFVLALVAGAAQRKRREQTEQGNQDYSPHGTILIKKCFPTGLARCCPRSPPACCAKSNLRSRSDRYPIATEARLPAMRTCATRKRAAAPGDSAGAHRFLRVLRIGTTTEQMGTAGRADSAVTHILSRLSRCV